LFPMARRLASLSGVEVSAPVSSLRGLLRRSTVAVAPKRFGTETRRGLLEAIAAGGARVPPPHGIGGPPLQNGREVFVEGSAAGFSERLIELLQRPNLREAMAAKGRAFIRLHYSSTAAASRLSDVVEATVNSHTRPRIHRSGRDAGVSA